MLGLFTVFAVSFVSYYTFKDALLKRSADQLSSINILKKSLIESYFLSRQEMFQYLAMNTEFVNIILGHKDFPDSTFKIENFPDSFDYKAIAFYDHNNSFINGTNHSFWNEFKSNTEERIVNQFLKAAEKEVVIEDFTAEFANKPQITLMIGAPVLNKNGEIVGKLIALKDYEKITKILYERTGMGETGESYLVSEEKKMRSRSRFYPEKSPDSINVNTVSVNNALNGKEGMIITKDYRGVPVISIYRPLKVGSLRWTILSEIDLNEALKPIEKLREKILFIAILTSLSFLSITLLLTTRITQPLLRLKNLIVATSKGQLPDKYPVPERLDEIGQMTRATSQMILGLRKTASFAQEIGNGNFDVPYTPLGTDDVLGHSLVQMRDKLKVLTENEVKLVRQNSLRLLEAQEEERKRIARELHDGIGQLLTATRFKVGEIKEENLKNQVRVLLDETISEIRRISNNLMPSVLTDFGMEAALEKLCKQTEDYSNINVSLLYQQDPDFSKVPFEVLANIFRIIQEALNNIVKHSMATEAEVAFFHSHDKIVVEIADNGRGLDESASTKGRGLHNMKERTEMAKGKLEVKTKTNQGTVILAEFPIE